MRAALRTHLVEVLLVAAVAAVLSFVALALQVRSMAGTRFGFSRFENAVQYLETQQLARHDAVIHGDAKSPWQYRVLSELMVEPVLRMAAASGVAHPVAWGFLLFRFLVGCAVFALAHVYYRQLGLDPPVAFLGGSLLMWGMSHAVYDSDLSLNTYVDVAAYLLAGTLIVRGLHAATIPLVALAALNRETSGLIPLLGVAAVIELRPRLHAPKGALVAATASLVLFLAVFFGLRVGYGLRPLELPYGKHPGLELLVHNVARDVSWIQLIATLGVLPLVAVLVLRRAPRVLQRFFWALVPLWIVVHLFGAVIAETRLLRVPLALVFVPVVLCGVVGRRAAAADAPDAARSSSRAAGLQPRSPIAR